MKKINQLSLAATTLLLAAPTFAAVSEDIPQGLDPVPASGDLDVAAVLSNIIIWVLGFSATVAVLFLIIGGLQYITASGNEKRAEAAKQTIMYAVVGLIVILLSFVIVGFIKTNVGSVVQ